MICLQAQRSLPGAAVVQVPCATLPAIHIPQVVALSHEEQLGRAGQGRHVPVAASAYLPDLEWHHCNGPRAGKQNQHLRFVLPGRTAWLPRDIHGSTSRQPPRANCHPSLPRIHPFYPSAHSV